ncbi:MAG TPA: hypothetical protein VEQ37_10105 [Actinomycetota bacterium]|nr:hypothetical protein [Actinomycetota bacterium]
MAFIQAPGSVVVVGHETGAGQEVQQLEVVVTGEHFDRFEPQGVDGFDGAGPDGGQRNGGNSRDDDGIAPPSSIPVRQYEARNGPFVIDPEELVNRVREPRRAPPLLQISGFPYPCLRIRQASALEELRRESEVLETRGAHLIDRHAAIL